MWRASRARPDRAAAVAAAPPGARRAAPDPARPAPRASRGGRCATSPARRAATRGCGWSIERFATYAGADPRRAPAALAVAGYVEHAFGAWHPRGGLLRLVAALARRLAALGGELRLGDAASSASASARGRATGVVDGRGRLRADAVVTDVDALALDRACSAGARAARASARCPGLALMLGLRGRTPGLAAPPDRLPRRLRRRVRRPLRRTAARCATRRSTSARRARPTRRARRRRGLVRAGQRAAAARADWDAEAERWSTGSACATGSSSARCAPRGDLERETGARRRRDLRRRAARAAGRAAAPRATAVRGVARPVARRAATVHPGGGLPLVALGAPQPSPASSDGVSQRVAPVPGPFGAVGAKAREQLLRVPALRARAPDRPRGARAAVGVGARVVEAAPQRERRLARDAATPRCRPTRAAPARRAGRGPAARSRGRSATRRAGPDRRAREDRDRAVAPSPLAGAAPASGSRPPQAPWPRERRQAHGVGLRPRPASARRPATRPGTRRARPRPPRRRTAPSAAGRPRASSSGRGPVPSRRQKRRPGVRAQQRAVQAHARERRGARRRAGSGRGGRRRARMEYVVAALAGYLLRLACPSRCWSPAATASTCTRPATATPAPGTRSSSSGARRALAGVRRRRR